MDERQDRGLAEVERLLRENGAEVKLIPVSYIVVDPRVRIKCLVPVCDSYNRGLMCPPNLPPLHEFREALARFSRALLVQYRQSWPSESGRDMKTAFDGARKLHELINLGEKQALLSGFRFATGLIGGSCHLCEECVGVNSGEKCRHPFRARPSMEAMGIDVIGTAEKAGMPLVFPVEDEVTWTGIILLD